MTLPLNRRQMLTGVGTAALGISGAMILSDRQVSAIPGSATQPALANEGGGSDPAFRFCLNTSTIREQKLTLEEEVDITAQAGYTGMEPWIREIDEFVNRGGKLKDLRKRIADAGLTVESAIGFASWIVDDDIQRAAGLESAKRDMDVVQQIGGTRIAAPPVGATRQADLNLFQAAERYRALLEVGKQIGVVPQLEVWGFSQSLSRLGEVMFVAVESGHADACLLPDVFHIYKGGSDFAGLSVIHGSAIHVFHMNDYPADPPRNEVNDGHRVYPGDGVAPLKEIVATLRRIGFRGALSLELFNRDYWQQDPLTVAKTGLEKMRAVVES